MIGKAKRGRKGVNLMFITSNPKLNRNTVFKLPECSYFPLKKSKYKTKINTSVELESLYGGNVDIPSPYADWLNK